MKKQRHLDAITTKEYFILQTDFNEEEKELLSKGLKYAPPPPIAQEKTIIECKTVIKKLHNEEMRNKSNGK